MRVQFFQMYCIYPPLFNYRIMQAVPIYYISILYWFNSLFKQLQLIDCILLLICSLFKWAMYHPTDSFQTNQLFTLQAYVSEQLLLGRCTVCLLNTVLIQIYFIRPTVEPINIRLCRSDDQLQQVGCSDNLIRWSVEHSFVGWMFGFSGELFELSNFVGRMFNIYMQVGCSDNHIGWLVEHSFVGPMFNLILGRMFKFCRSDLLYGQMFNFCWSDVQLLQVGCSILVGLMLNFQSCQLFFFCVICRIFFFYNYFFFTFIILQKYGTEHRDIKQKSHITSLSLLLCLAIASVCLTTFHPLW